MFGLGWPELLIILAVALLLFGGSRLAGVGKGTGRAIREFKEETQGLRNKDASAATDSADPATGADAAQNTNSPAHNPNNQAQN